MTPERELAELRSKIEEYREWLGDSWPHNPRVIPTKDQKFLVDKAVSMAAEKFSSLFPPPKKGCWGFFRDYRKEPYRKESGLTGRMFESCEDEDHANRVRDCFDSMNPGPVFFLEEK